jgi:hypothetical protein
MINHPDFRAIETPWGTQILHKRNIVWYSHYPLASRAVHYWTGKPPSAQKGIWVAYYTTNDYVGEKPWCNSNWKINQQDMFTEEEAIKACLRHLEHVDSLRNNL